MTHEESKPFPVVNDGYKSRKLQVALVIFATSAAAVFFQKISGDNYVSICAATFGFYCAGNVAEKFRK